MLQRTQTLLSNHCYSISNMDDTKMEIFPRIPAVFAGKNVFVTGATGFLGKVLVEKLLRSCPDIGDVYVLMRMKKGKKPEERLKEITELPLFDKLRETNPAALKKLKPITGDTTQLGIGLSSSDRQILIDNVNIVYHTAASVRFDEPLRDAIILNTRGTREMVLLAQEFKQLDMFVHISTTYCNTNQKVIDEELYPQHTDWRMAIKLAEEMDEHVLEVLTAKYLGELPNTYTFTKQLAEHVVYDLCKGRIPAVVIRPSIVISSLDDPFPGWVDNFNGVVGIFAGTAKGLIHVYYSELNHELNYIPVDVCIKGIIVATWYQLIKPNNLKDKEDVAFYNACTTNAFFMTLEDMADIGISMLVNNQLTVGRQIWYPTMTITNNKYKFYVLYLFYQLLPALLVDGIMKLIKKKPFLAKIQRKIYIAVMALEYFAFNNWIFLNKNFMSLNKRIPMEDVKDFYFFHEHVNTYEYYKMACFGGAKYLLHANINDDNQKKNQRRLKHLHYFVVYTFYTLLFLFMVQCLGNITTYFM